jgi:hypothetical protein
LDQTFVSTLMDYFECNAALWRNFAWDAFIIVVHPATRPRTIFIEPYSTCS